MSVYVKLSDLRSKFFLKPNETPEFELAKAFLTEGPALAWRNSKFYLLRVGKISWVDPSVSHLPSTVGRIPPYWQMPWYRAVRGPVGWIEKFRRRMEFRKVLREFFSLIQSLEKKGWDLNSEPIKAIELVADSGSKRYIYLDGNRRIGAFAAVLQRHDVNWEETSIPIEIRKTILESKLFEDAQVMESLAQGDFSKAEVDAWTRHALEC